MTAMSILITDKPYSICAIDIGSPKLGNIGWCLIDVHCNSKKTGTSLDELIPHISKTIRKSGLLLGLEAPLFVPMRNDLMLATKGRNGEGRRPWSAGAGAQVLAMNIPIMTYLFRKIKFYDPDVDILIDPKRFAPKERQVLLFEALVSGIDKGNSHVDDAQIMTNYCLKYSKKSQLPPSILKHEEDTSYFNLAAASLLRCGLTKDVSLMEKTSPIYKPSPGGF